MPNKINNNYKVVDTKSIVKTEIAPSYSFPESFEGPAFKPGPVKHWRKSYTDKSSRVTNLTSIPGGTTVTSKDPCDGDIINHFTTEIHQNSDSCACEPSVTRRATTVVDKKYYSDYRSKYRHECKTVNQTSCAKNNCLSHKKYSNAGFSKMGGVDSSTRIQRVKYNTLTKNGASYKSAFGYSGSNFGKYHAGLGSMHFIKSDVQPSSCNRRTYRKRGHKTLCFV